MSQTAARSTLHTITRHTPLDALPELLRVPEVARLLDCSAGVIYELLKSGKLSSIRLGRLLRVSRSSLAAFVKP